MFSFGYGLIGLGIALLSGIGYGRFFLLCFEYWNGGWILSLFSFFLGCSSSSFFGTIALLVDFQSLGIWLGIHVSVLSA